MLNLENVIKMRKILHDMRHANEEGRRSIMKKKLKPGDTFTYHDNSYIVTDIPVPGTFLYYAINQKTGKNILIRPDMLSKGLPLVYL